MKELIYAVDKNEMLSRVFLLDDAVEAIVSANKQPKFYMGYDWGQLMITSVELDTKHVDTLLQARHNAWHIYEHVAKESTADFTIENTEDGNDITAVYQHELEGTDELARVSYENGEVTFVLANMLDIEWTIVEVY